METVNSSPQNAQPKVGYTWVWVYRRIAEIKKQYPNAKFYGIPRGGQIVAGLTGQAVDTPEEATHFIDDVIDSGMTAERWIKKYPKIGRVNFLTLHSKTTPHWVVFPWEQTDTTKDAEDHITRMLEMIGEDASRDGLKETPKRVLKSWEEIFSGYKTDPKDHVKVFEKGTYDQMIVLKDCELYSTCEHHMQPFYGKAHIAYIPKDKVIGISKLARIMECFARRLQIQERIGEQVTNFLMQELKAMGAGCVIEAKHFCMCARGVNKQNSTMLTSSLNGVFRQSEVRQEFFNLIN